MPIDGEFFISSSRLLQIFGPRTVIHLVLMEVRANGIMNSLTSRSLPETSFLDLVFIDRSGSQTDGKYLFLNLYINSAEQCSKRSATLSKPRFLNKGSEWDKYPHLLIIRTARFCRINNSFKIDFAAQPQRILQ